MTCSVEIGEPAALDSTRVEQDPRQRLLAAAKQVFAEKGLRGARTREIARLAGVNLAMLHYYFHSKEELYVQVLTPIFTEVFQRLRTAATAHENPRKRLEGVITVYFDFLKNNPDLPRLVMWALVSDATTLKKIFADLNQGRRDDLSLVLMNIFQEGHKSNDDPLRAADQYVISMVAMCIFPFIAREIIQTINPEFVGWSDFLGKRQAHILNILSSAFAERHDDKSI